MEGIFSNIQNQLSNKEVGLCLDSMFAVGSVLRRDRLTDQQTGQTDRNRRGEERGGRDRERGRRRERERIPNISRSLLSSLALCVSSLAWASHLPLLKCPGLMLESL